MDIERIRQFCLAMPGTAEAVKYGDQLCFMVAGKHFCSSNLKGLDKINFKVADEQFEELCEREGIGPAPYGGAKFKWVQVGYFDALTDPEWEALLQLAYQSVKAKLPKKVQRELEL